LPGNGAAPGRWHGVRYIPGTFPARNLPMSWLVTKYHLVAVTCFRLFAQAVRPFGIELL
jgi:hypothetical protein